MYQEKLVVIAASTGGPRVLVDIFSRIPATLPAAVIIVQHMLPRFIDSFAFRLQKISGLPVSVGMEGMPVRKKSVILAPGEKHLLVRQEKDGVYVVLDDSPPNQGVIPSADFTMISAAPIYQKRIMGVILTGMGRDGVEGFKEIKRFGGYTVVEDKQTSVAYGMPGNALKMGVADRVLTPEGVAEEIVRFSWEESGHGYVEI